ncbi:MAG: Rne/Rng family ribonuclease [Calditrichia bacterium]
MKKDIVINSTNEDVRIALMENSRLAELFVERPDNERMVGDIYKGRVRKVVRGMQAAFIDIGFQQDSFLHFSDMGSNRDQLFIDTEDDDSDAEEKKEKTKETANNGRKNGKSNDRGRRGRGRHDKDGDNRGPYPFELLKNGQEILVQIIKEPIANKGPRVTTELSVPGRFMVLVPNQKRIGVSRKISSYKEKKRLRSIVRKMLPKGFGCIIRTVAEGKDAKLIEGDLQRLIRNWEEIQKQHEVAPDKSLIFKDVGMATSIIRDLFTGDINKVHIDSRKMLREVTHYLKDVGADQLIDKVEYFSKREPIFDHFKIEEEIQRSIEKKVWMSNGGYIIIEHTEALTVVDVNSGRFFGRKNHERNSLKINLDASREIARQLRLRDVGGLIVIDFIDMEQSDNKRKILNELNKEFARDRSVTKAEGMSRFGLVEMTRQRIRPSLIYNIHETCEDCGGTGLVPTVGTIVADIERTIRRFVTAHRDRRVVLRLHPQIAEYLNNKRFGRRFQLMWKYWAIIQLEEDETLKPHEFRVLKKRGRQDVTTKFSKPLANSPA